MYVLHIYFIGKLVVDFSFMVIELLSQILMFETLYAEICRSGHFLKRVGHFECRYKGGHRPTTVGFRKLVIAFLYGIKMSAVAQHVWQADRQNYDSYIVQ